MEMKKIRYLISYALLIAISNNARVGATEIAEDCGCEEHGQFKSERAGEGIVAEGSAISSQFVLPDGSVHTHSRETSISNGDVRRTYETLKHEANQFVSKQKDTINVPNVHVPSLSNVHLIPNYITGGQASQQQYSSSGSYQNSASSGSSFNQGEDAYSQSAVPGYTKVTSTKHKYVEEKKVYTNKGKPSNTDESVEQTEFIRPSGGVFTYEENPSSHGQAHVSSSQYGSNSHVSSSQSGSSSSHHSSSGSRPIGGVTDIIINSYPNVVDEQIHPFVTNQVPTKIITENKESESQQTEQKYTAVPVTYVQGSPIKIKYTYDGKNAVRVEEYSNGQLKYYPITIDEYENALKQNPSASQITIHKNPGAAHSYQKVESESSQSKYTSGGQSSNSGYFGGAENIGSEGGTIFHKIIPGPVKHSSSESSSSYSYHQSSSSKGGGHYGGIPNSESSVLVHEGIQTIPIKLQSSGGSSGSSYNYHSSGEGHFGGGVDSLGQGNKHGALLIHGVPIGGGSSGSSYSSSYSSSSQYSSSGSTGGGPGKGNYHEIKTSYASSAVNNNGKKSENREASVSVNDNGKLDSYHVKS